MPRKFIQVLIQRKCIGNIKWQFKKSDWSDYVRKIKVLNSGNLKVMKLSYLEEFFFKKNDHLRYELIYFLRRNEFTKYVSSFEFYDSNTIIMINEKK